MYDVLKGTRAECSSYSILIWIIQVLWLDIIYLRVLYDGMRNCATQHGVGRSSPLLMRVRELRSKINACVRDYFEWHKASEDLGEKALWDPVSEPTFKNCGQIISIIFWVLVLVESDVRPDRRWTLGGVETWECAPLGVEGGRAHRRACQRVCASRQASCVGL